MKSPLTYASESQWPRAIPGKLNNDNEIEVWRASLDATTPQLKNLQAILSSDEIERAGRFRFERDQERFIVARGILRQILSQYLGLDPHEIRFDYTPNGKPLLAADAWHDGLRFNLSHSDAFAVYAVARDRDIGIDIERVRNDVAADQIAKRFFSKGEINSLEGMHENKRIEAFYQYWTRKEAFIKATGEGISFPLEQCDVSLMTGDAFAQIILEDKKRENEHWHAHDLIPGHGYVAAVATKGRDWTISCREFAG